MSDTIIISPDRWKLMRKLWQGAPLTISQLVRELREETGWSKATVITMLNRLEEKGAVRWEQAEGERARRYYPAVDQHQVAVGETSALLERAFQGRVGLLVSAMLDEHALSAAEIDELSALLEQAKQEVRHENRT